MDEVGAYEAKTHFAELLDRVAAGERITLTKHGKPVALLIPIEKKPPAAEVIRQIREFRRGRRLEGITVRELIDEGRR